MTLASVIFYPYSEVLVICSEGPLLLLPPRLSGLVLWQGVLQELVTQGAALLARLVVVPQIARLEAPHQLPQLHVTKR